MELDDDGDEEGIDWDAHLSFRERIRFVLARALLARPQVRPCVNSVVMWVGMKGGGRGVWCPVDLGLFPSHFIAFSGPVVIDFLYPLAITATLQPISL